MPSIILSKAASTPVEGATGVEVALGRCDAAPVSVDLGVGFGEGFGSTVRVRVVVVEEFEFWANTNMALTNTIEAMTRNLFNMISSSGLATEAGATQRLIKARAVVSVSRYCSLQFLCASVSLWQIISSRTHSTDAGSANASPNARGQLSQRLQTLTVPRPGRSTWCAQ